MVLAGVARVSVEGPCPGRCGFRLFLYPAAGENDYLRAWADLFWPPAISVVCYQRQRGFQGSGGRTARNTRFSFKEGDGSDQTGPHLAVMVCAVGLARVRMSWAGTRGFGPPAHNALLFLFLCSNLIQICFFSLVQTWIVCTNKNPA